MTNNPITNPVKAIRAKCLDCCCGQQTGVKECVCVECPLFPFRFGKNPYRKRREISPEARKVLGDRLNQAKNSHTTTVEKFGDEDENEET